MSELAMGIAFCDAISPFIVGGIDLCGIPTVRVIDTPADYETMAATADVLANTLIETPASAFFQRIRNRAQKIKNVITSTNESTFFDKMFRCCNCSSGHPVYESEGWFNEFLSPSSARRLSMYEEGMNWATAIMKNRTDAPFEEIVFAAGVFSSVYDAEHNILVPKFDRVVVGSNSK